MDIPGYVCAFNMLRDKAGHVHKAPPSRKPKLNTLAVQVQAELATLSMGNPSELRDRLAYKPEEGVKRTFFFFFHGNHLSHCIGNDKI